MMAPIYENIDIDYCYKMLFFKKNVIINFLIN